MSYLSEVCSIMQEVAKNKELQSVIRRGEISRDLYHPSQFLTNYSNFSAMDLTAEGEGFSVQLPDSYPVELWFKFKNLSGKRFLQNNGLDKDDDNCVPYNPAKGLKSNGDICVSLE